MSSVIVNIDVPDLTAGVTFYTKAFGLKTGRRLGDEAVELTGFPTPVYLLERKEGSLPFKGAKQGRDYGRHWSPVHLDIVVDSLDTAISQAKAAGAKLE